MAVALYPPAARAAAGPAVSISIDNGRTAVAAGDRVTYTVTVRNIGTTAARLRVSQVMPAGLTFIAADRQGRPRHGQVTWPVSVAAGRHTVLRATMLVQRPPAGDRLLAAVACAAVDGDRRPLVCASDSDRLPAATVADRPTAAPAPHHPWRPPVIPVAVVALSVLAAAAILVVRRRRGVTAVKGSPPGL
jgi:uncharacterized repeat protein (TIGR01451 family)